MLETTLYVRANALINCNLDVGYSLRPCPRRTPPRLSVFQYGRNFELGSRYHQCSVVSELPPCPATRKDGRSDFWRVIGSALSRIITLVNTAQTSTTDFGRVIYKRSQLSNPETYMDSQTLLNATNVTFTAIWAMPKTQTLMKPAAQSSIVNDVLFKSKTRQFVVLQVAYSIIAVPSHCLPAPMDSQPRPSLPIYSARETSWFARALRPSL